MAELTPSEKLFEVTRDNLETGLRGYPVGYCITSSVDPQKGLFYSGIPVTDLIGLPPAHVIYLLYHGKLGNQAELEAFSTDLQRRSSLKPEVIAHIRQLPRSGHPMKLFCNALLILGMLEGKNDYREDALDVVAKIPALAATVINYHAGWQSVEASAQPLGYLENFTHLLNPPGASSEALTRVFNLFSILHYDHGGGNLSAFTGKAIASGLEDLYGSLSGAMCALAGPRHGRANQDSLEQLQDLTQRLGHDATVEQVEGEVRRRLDEHQLIYGFGHAVLRVEDPRATILYQFAQDRYPNDPLIKMALKLRQAGSKVLSENVKVADPYPNIDAISGSLMMAAGFPYPIYFTVLFGLARCVGIARQIVYERCEAREGKGVPIYRPKFFFLKRS
jgi:citrate synthase